MLAPPVIRGGRTVRAASLVLGLFLFALGIVLLLESELGLSPWDVLSQGLAEQTPLTFGTASIVIGLAVLVLAWRLGARIGSGTVANAVLIGLFIEGLVRLDAVADLSESSLATRVALMLGGIFVIGVGSGFYIGAAMEAGPRDSLMLVLSRRTGVRIGAARTVLEIAATAAGWALGGTVGLGTLAFALLVGTSVELAFFGLLRSRLTVAEVPSPA